MPRKETEKQKLKRLAKEVEEFQQLIEKCKSKALNNYRNPEYSYAKITWSPTTVTKFNDLFDLFLKELQKNLTVKLKQKRKRTKNDI